MSRTPITEEKLMSLTQGIIDTPTPNPPGQEAPLVDLLLDRLEASPVDFTIEPHEIEPGRPNLVARAGDPENGSLLLTGHTDVVPANADDWTGDPYELRRDGDYIVGRGTADMKGSLAAKLVAAETFLKNHEDTGEVILGFVADEENSGAGTVALIEEGIEADAAILGEPTNMQPAIAEYGFIGYTLTVEGESGHSGRPDLSVNAIDGLRVALNRVADLDREVRQQDHPVLEPGPSISITEIDGGIAPNVVPDHATATVTWRTLPGTSLGPEAFDQQLANALESIEINSKSVNAESNRWIYARPSEINADEQIVKTLLNAAADEGLSCDPTGFNAGSDARFLIHDADIPTVLFGPGSIEDDAHTVDESIHIDDLIMTAQVYYRTLERFLLSE